MKKDLRNKILATAAGVTLFTTMALGHNTPWGIFGGSGDNGKVTTYQYATADDLGSANSFAVVAETFNKENHMEGTFATGKLNTGSDICGITNNVKGYINPNENLIYVADVDDISHLQTNNGVDTDLLVLPKGTTFDYSYNNGVGLSLSYDGKTANYNSKSSMNIKDITTTDKTDYKIDFAKAMESLSTYANARLSENTEGKNTTVVKDSKDVDQNNRKITVKCGAGKNVINISAEELVDYMIDVQGPTDEAFSLVVNVKAGNGSYLFNKRVTVNGDNSGYGACGGMVLFNFGNGAGTYEFQQTTLGVILAPKGDVICKATHNGSVFAKTVTNDGCEIHQNPFKQFVEKQEETTTEEITTVETTTEEKTTEETTTEEITTEEKTTEEITTEEITTEEVVIETETTTEEITTEAPTQDVVIETEPETEEKTTVEETTTEEITTEAPSQDVVVETEETVEEETEEETDIVLNKERESKKAKKTKEKETEAEIETNGTQTVEENTPQTGDNANIPLMAVICTVSLAGVIVLKKVKKEN